MAARSAAAPRRARPAPSRSRSRSSTPPGLRRVAWDRLGRVALLLCLLGVVLLYVGPAASYLETWREAKKRNAEVQRLEAEHDRLAARRAALRRPATLEREARRLGMVRPGERAYVIENLPGG